MELITKPDVEPADVCRHCKFAFDLHDLNPREIPKGSLTCRRFPPQGVVVPVKAFDPKRGHVSAPQLQFLSPNVDATWSCGEFAMKLAVRA